MRQYTTATLISTLQRALELHGDLPVVIEGGGYDDSNYKLSPDHITFEGSRLVISMAYRDEEEPENQQNKKARTLTDRF